MQTQIHSLCLVMVVAAVYGSWIPNAADWSDMQQVAERQTDSELPDRPSRRTSNSRRASRHNRHHEGRRSPRLFDEFLQVIAISGEIPTMNSDGSFISRSGSRPADERNSSDSDVLSSMRSYIRGHRPSVREDVEVLEEEIDSDNLQQSSDDVRSDRVQRSNAAEQVHRQSKRDTDFSSIERSLEGIPRSHWSCCFLGQLAGDKGFLCDADFYASRVLDRNANRVHNRRLTGTYFQDGRATDTGEELLNSFNSCVQTYSSANEFETCCTTTARHFEERENRWSSFSNRLQSNS